MLKKMMITCVSLGLLMGMSNGMAASHHHASKNQAIPAKYKTADNKVNINTVDEADLIKVKGIGAKRAADIVAYRKAHGPFKSLNDLTNVKGIGPKMVKRIGAELAVA